MLSFFLTQCKYTLRAFYVMPIEIFLHKVSLFCVEEKTPHGKTEQMTLILVEMQEGQNIILDSYFMVGIVLVGF